MAKTFCARPLGDRKERVARLLGGRRLGIVLSDHTDDDGATISRHACRIRPLPDNLPVERIVEPPPCACGKCGSIRLRKLGEVVSKMLDCEPRRWKIVEHVREKFTCRSPSRRRHRVRFPAGLRDRACSPWCWSRSSYCICRSIARVTLIGARRRVMRPARVLICENDTDVIRLVEPPADGHDVEIMEGARVVARLHRGG
jgi:zinc-finger binding domain of transposase IS66